MNQCHHLLKLAEGWRSKAAHIQAKYGAAAPNTVRHCVIALETCAEELEGEIRRTVAVPPAIVNPKS